MECKFCHTIFTSKYVLVNHQKRAKYCLNIQKENGKPTTEDLFTCEYCNISVAGNTQKRHYDSCKKRLHKCIEELEKENERLITENKLYKELSEHERSNKLPCVENITRQPQIKHNDKDEYVNITNIYKTNEKFSAWNHLEETKSFHLYPNKKDTFTRL